MKHIGMDLHSTTTDICVRNGAGRIVLKRKIQTTPKELEAFICGVSGQKRVAVEESQMADWVSRLLAPHVQEVIRSQPRHNRLISGSEDKWDDKDAEALSELLFLNRLKPVHSPPAQYRALREGVRAYWIASGELTRAKNRLKAFFLSNGAHQVGRGVYCLRKREQNLQAIEKQGWNEGLARLNYERLDHCRRLKAKHVMLLRKLANAMKGQVKCLTSIPGIGPIGAYSLVAYLEDGRRIPNKRKLWRYAGLSLRRHESRDKGTQGASYSGNRMVKRVLMSAAITVISRQADNALARYWEAGIRQNVDAKRMRRNLARKIAVIAHLLLRSKQEYRDERVVV
jgi:transposase